MTLGRRTLALASLIGAIAGFEPRAAWAQGQDGEYSGAAPRHAQTIDMNLVVGENKTVSAQDVTSYTTAAQGIVDVKVTPDKGQFVFGGLRPGSTTVLLLKRSGLEVTYVITVYSRSPEAVEGELEKLLVGYTGLRIRKVGSRFFIEGGVSTDADARRVGLVASLYPGQVESLVVVGSVGLEHTINVRIDFYFIQFDKTSDYGVGISWPATVGGGNLNLSHDFMTSATTATASVEQPLPALDAAQTRGWAKVLKHSTVITTSGSEATFEDGGEQNFAVSAGLTSDVRPIKFGTNVTVLPRYDLTTRDLEVKINANVSGLTAPAGVATLPGRKTASVSTFVHLKLGQSIVLSGIRSREVTHSVSGVPLLSQIPVLGLLFGGHTNSEAEIEGAVFVVPSIVESAPRRAYDIVGAAMRQYEHYSGAIDEASTYPHDPPAYR